MKSKGNSKELRKTDEENIRKKNLNRNAKNCSIKEGTTDTPEPPQLQRAPGVSLQNLYFHLHIVGILGKLYRYLPVDPASKVKL